MSPILFNILADMLVVLINRPKVDGEISGIIPHLVNDGLSILQYVDDTILFIDIDIEKAKNFKLLLTVFEQLYDLKINFYKSVIFFYGEAIEFKDQYMELFGCNVGEYLLRYLGIPMHHRKL